jgi:hypothetical protein
MFDGEVCFEFVIQVSSFGIHLRRLQTAYLYQRGDMRDREMSRLDFCNLSVIIQYTVTRPYAGFRHPDRMAPDQTVRGGENDYSIWSGNLLPHLPKFSVITGIFRRFFTVKKLRPCSWVGSILHP